MHIDPKIMTLYYWFLDKGRNVKFLEMLQYLIAPNPKIVASRCISNKTKINNFIRISFNTLKDKLYWPIRYNMNDLYLICSEIFNQDNWHYYENGNMKVERGDVVVDIGASEGLFALSIVNRCEKVLIIEPDAHFFDALLKTFNKYIPEKAELFKVAVGSTNSFIGMENNGILSTVSGQPGNITMKTLDEILGDREKIDYIKADIEGYEMEMLKGAVKTISKHKPKLIITTYHEPNDYKEIINFVKNIVPEYNYRIKGITHYNGKPVMVQFWI